MIFATVPVVSPAHRLQINVDGSGGGFGNVRFSILVQVPLHDHNIHILDVVLLHVKRIVVCAPCGWIVHADSRAERANIVCVVLANNVSAVRSRVYVTEQKPSGILRRTNPGAACFPDDAIVINESVGGGLPSHDVGHNFLGIFFSGWLPRGGHDVQLFVVQNLSALFKYRYRRVSLYSPSILQVDYVLKVWQSHSID